MSVPSVAESKVQGELQRIVNGIRNRATRKAAAEELRGYVSTQATELPPERLTLFQRMLNQQLQTLFRGKGDAVDITVGTVCVNVLIEVDFMDPNLKITQFSNYIYKALNTEHRGQAEIAAATLGKIVKIETALTQDIVEAEAKRCFEWLNDETQSKHKRYVGSLVMKELVQAVPNMLLKRYTLFLTSVWSAIGDKSIEVRRVAATALHALIQGVIKKDSTEGEREWRSRIIEKLFDEAMASIHTSAELCHGSLLALQQLYALSDDNVLNQGFRTVCDAVLKLTETDAPAPVLQAVIQLLPILADFYPTAFSVHLPAALQLLIRKVQESEPGAFVAIGKIVEATARDPQALRVMEAHIAGLLGMIFDRLSRPVDEEEEARHCREELTPADPLDLFFDTATVPDLEADGQSNGTALENNGAWEPPQQAVADQQQPPEHAAGSPAASNGKRQSEQQLGVHRAPSVASSSASTGGRRFFSGMFTRSSGGAATPRRGGAAGNRNSSGGGNNGGGSSGGGGKKARPGDSRGSLEAAAGAHKGLPAGAANGNGAGAAAAALLSVADTRQGIVTVREQAEGLACLTSICAALPERVDVRQRLHGAGFQAAIFSLPVTPSVVVNLNRICSSIPSFLPACQQCMLAKTSQHLVDRAYHPNRPELEAGWSALQNGSFVTLSPLILKSTTKQRILQLQALKALQAFNLSGHDLAGFTETCCVPYLGHTDLLLRKESALACCKLLHDSATYYKQVEKAGYKGVSRTFGVASPSSQQHKSQVLNILKSVSALAVTDIDPENRLCILSKLEESTVFDPFIATPACLTSLTLAVNDSNPQVGDVAVRFLGRLSSINPAATLPSLRRVLIQLIAELSYALDAQRQDTAASTLAKVVQSSPSLVEPYVQSMSSALFARLQDNSHRIHGTLLLALGELCDYSGKSVAPLVDQIVPTIIRLLKEKPTAKAVRCAVTALGKIVRGSGRVSLFLDYPTLLDLLIDALQGADKEPMLTRLEIMKTIGAAGALDPHTVVSLKNRSSDNEAAPSAGLGASVLPASDPYYNTYTVVNALLSVLGSPSQNMHHRSAVQAIQMTIRSLPPEKSVHLLPRIIPAFLKLLNDNLSVPASEAVGGYMANLAASSAFSTFSVRDRGFAEFMFRALSTVVSIVKQHVRKYQQQIVATIKTFWDPTDQAVLLMILSLCEELRRALNEEFDLVWLMPLLIRMVSTDAEGEKVLSIKAMSCFETMGKLLEPYLHLSVPCMAACSASGQPFTLRVRALRAVRSLCQQKLMIRHHAATLLHALLTTVSEPAPPGAVVADDEDVGVKTASFASAGQSQPASYPTQPHPSIQSEAALTIEALLVCVSNDADTFMPMVTAVMETVPVFTHGAFSFNARHHLTKYRATLHALRQGQSAPALMPTVAQQPPLSDGHLHGENKGQTTNFAALRKAWQVSGAASGQDYVSWLTHFGQKLLQESPSPALKACFDIARRHPLLMFELFNVAFVSCYFDLSDRHKTEMLDSVRKPLQAENLPDEVLQTLLNLAEFLDRCDRSGQLQPTAQVNGQGSFRATGGIMSSFCPPQQLAALSERCQLYAKSLHYHETSVRHVETSMRKCSSTDQWPTDYRIACLDACRSLVHVNNCLELPESSEGILKYIQKHNIDLGVGLTADMYVNLGWWEKALTCYEDEVTTQQKNGVVPSASSVIGMFRCLDQLGDWPRLLTLAKAFWQPSTSFDMKRRLSPMIGHAAWLMSQWDIMNEATELMPDYKIPGFDFNATTVHFYRAILSFQEGNYEGVGQSIHQCRTLMDRELSTQVAESYSRAYELIVCLQQLSELEEIIDYVNTTEERKANYKKNWSARLQRMNRDPKYLQGTLAIHSLVIAPTENLTSWLDFVETCRWSGKMKKAQQVLLQLLGRDVDFGEHLSPQVIVDDPTANPRVVIEYLKHLWIMGSTGVGPRSAGLGEQAKTLHHELLLCLSSYARNLRFEEAVLQQGPKGKPPAEPLVAFPLATDDIKARILLLTATWQQLLSPNAFWQPPHRDGILAHLSSALGYDPNGYRTWHAWALLNYRIALRDETLTHEDDLLFVTRAVEGFVKSISLCEPSELAVQDLLRLLRVWFNFGADADVAKVVAREIDKVNIDMWLQVIPQVIARIDTPEQLIQANIKTLLSKIANRHPQAVTYPLVVCASPTDRSVVGSGAVSETNRRRCAREVLEQLRLKQSNLVDQAELVAKELIRVAILWSETWLDALEEASRLYFGDHDPHGMIAVLASLYEKIENCSTENERHFVQIFGKDLRDARFATGLWKRTGRNTDMTQAWDLYYTAFRRLQRQLGQMTSIELQTVSPELFKVTDFELAVPGQYQAGSVPVCIKSFAPTLKVITSKQRPRKLTIIGSDGLAYKFLLKGHEDLRQDERVMQLFGLVNTLLRNDKAITRAARADLTITQYPVIPLSSNAGLIGWLDRAETLHSLITDYREKQRMQLNTETKYMQQHAGDYDILSLMQKVEVFEHALNHTDGDDLNNILWLKASNSEVWLERRTNFTRSLATMSMVGYILGLGDRHPSNLMLDHSTGKAIHIDFGDCFEVAVQREKFPEKIPFRLTRMLVRAMEVSGIEGGFRRTSELVMGMLRRNRDSLMAMLEAFVYDPLISWRLETEVTGQQPSPAATNPQGGAPPQPHDRLLPHNAAPALDAGSFSGAGRSPGARYSRSLHEKTLLKNREKHAADPKAGAPAAAHPSTNKRAMLVVQRIKQKLDGTDFQDTHKDIRLTTEENIYPSRARKNAKRPFPAAPKAEVLLSPQMGPAAEASVEPGALPTSALYRLVAAVPSLASADAGVDDIATEAVQTASEHRANGREDVAAAVDKLLAEYMEGLDKNSAAAPEFPSLGPPAETPALTQAYMELKPLVPSLSDAQPPKDDVVAAAIRALEQYQMDDKIERATALDHALTSYLQEVDSVGGDGFASADERVAVEKFSGAAEAAIPPPKLTLTDYAAFCGQIGINGPHLETSDVAALLAFVKEAQAKIASMPPNAGIAEDMAAVMDFVHLRLAIEWAERTLAPENVSLSCVIAALKKQQAPQDDSGSDPCPPSHLAHCILLTGARWFQSARTDRINTAAVQAAEQYLARYGVNAQNAVNLTFESLVSMVEVHRYNGHSVPQEDRGTLKKHLLTLKNLPTGRVRSATKIQSLFRGIKARKDTRLRILLGEETDQSDELVVVDVPQQVDKLISMATSNENLAQCYIGWCPFW